MIPFIDLIVDTLASPRWWLALLLTVGSAAQPALVDRQAVFKAGGLDYRTQAQTVNHPLASLVVGRLNAGQDIDYYRVSVDQVGMFLLFQLSVTVPDGQEFRPGVAVIGPGLPSSLVAVLGNPFSLEGGEGLQAWLDSHPERPRTFSWYAWEAELLGVSGSISFPQAGEYWLAVYQLRGPGGQYRLSLGNGEPLRWGRAVNRLTALVRIRLGWHD